jgi:amino acid transporter
MIRGIGLRGAIAVNVITMIGIGPLITIPLVLTHLHGSLALVAWIVGALIALCDGLIWAELGSQFPGSGGTYVFLREAFGREGLGRMLAFLFTWQTVLSVPLLLASGYIGFAHYATYLWPALDAPLPQGVVAATVALVTVVALYRPIGNIAKASIAFGIVAVATVFVVIFASVPHFSPAQAAALDPHLSITSALFVGLGPALVITLYDYYGYGQVCFVGDEVREPRRTLPLAIIASLAIVGGLYILLQIGVLGAVPWTSLVAATPDGAPPAAAAYVASNVIELGWGVWAARAATVAILVTAFASTFGNLLGFSRIPFAAARDGVFLRPFGILHERGHFPHVSLLVIGLLAVPFCFFSLDQVIAWLTTAIILIQNLGQIAALVVLRIRGERAPYRMWFFPLPLIAATGAWIWIFWSSGLVAIAYGLGTLLIGTIVYLVFARLQSQWPFALATSLFVLFLFGALGQSRAQAADLLPTPPPLPAQAFTHAAIVERDGFPVFEVDGKPFFVYGAAFFYERLPRSEWARSMESLKQLGINTLDLYVIWNWHELKDGDFDFDGRTSPRRDLRYLLQLARQNGFKLIVRPGPVIRNEWRNGGYPAWLLSRPEYGMPLHDLLEGRYPPTATLQNAHSDDAAAEWMRNTTHMRYSTRWIRRALEEFRPYADLVLAVQLDDDQGAYLDNQTWPAPHLTAYLNHLKSVVHSVTGPLEPVFINTYQMKVTASSPVWAMGNWYQSDTYSIGEHDRVQLELSTGLLQTRPHQPLMYSEFQAGWLLGPDDIRPRPADPSNTLLAMTTLLGMGVRGIVNFPAQDTLYPTGWEVPFANWFYAWDAALGLGYPRIEDRSVWDQVTINSRWAPSQRIGDFVRKYGTDLARSRPAADAAIAVLASVESAPTNLEIAALAAQASQAQRACRAASLSCRLIDLQYAGDKDLRSTAIVFIPYASEQARRQLHMAVKKRLSLLVESDATVVEFTGTLTGDLIDKSLARAHHHRVVDFLPGAAFAVDVTKENRGFLFLPNYTNQALSLQELIVTPPHGTPTTLRNLAVAARDVALIPLGFPPINEPYQFHHGGPITDLHGDVTPLRSDTFLGTHLNWCPNGLWSERGVALRPCPSEVSRDAQAIATDVFAEGSQAVTFENALVRIVVAPNGGARAFSFADKKAGTSIFTTVGGLRDDVKIEPPLSKTDRIAKYTHQMPAGMFNRPYGIEKLEGGNRAIARFMYDAPDVVPAGAHFEKTVMLEPDSRSFTMDELATFDGDASRIGQRAVSVTSLAVGDTRKMTTQMLLSPAPSAFAADKTVVVSGNVLGFYDTVTHELATIAWRPGDVEDAKILERRFSIITRLTLAPARTARTAYGYYFAETLDSARAKLAEAGAALQGQPPELTNTTAR